MDGLTEKLLSYGADPETALKRLLGDTAFYERLLHQFVNDPDWERLRGFFAGGLSEEAYVVVHRMKGSAADLSLTSLYETLSELNTLLREGEEVDWTLTKRLFSEREELKMLLV